MYISTRSLHSLSMETYKCPHDMSPGFPQNKWSKQAKQSSNVFYFLTLEVTLYYSLYCWSHRLMLMQCGRRLLHECECQEVWGSFGIAFWMPATPGRDSRTKARIIRKNLLGEYLGGGHSSWREQQFWWPWGRKNLVFSRNRHKARLSKWRSGTGQVHRERDRLH